MPSKRRGHGWTHKKIKGPRIPYEYSHPHTVKDWRYICFEARNLTTYFCKADTPVDWDRDDYDEHCWDGDDCPCQKWRGYRRRLEEALSALRIIKDPVAVPPVDLLFSLLRLHFEILEFNPKKEYAYSLVYRNKHPQYPSHFI